MPRTVLNKWFHHSTLLAVIPLEHLFCGRLACVMGQECCNQHRDQGPAVRGNDRATRSRRATGAGRTLIKTDEDHSHPHLPTPSQPNSKHVSFLPPAPPHYSGRAPMDTGELILLQKDVRLFKGTASPPYMASGQILQRTGLWTGLAQVMDSGFYCGESHATRSPSAIRRSSHHSPSIFHLCGIPSRLHPATGQASVRSARSFRARTCTMCPTGIPRKV